MQVVEWCRLPCHGRLAGRAAGGGGIAQIVIAGNTEDAEAMCICEVVREMVQVRMQVVVLVTHSILESAMHLQSADYLLVVLTKGLLRCEAFARVLLTFRENPIREGAQVEIVTVLADTAFDFPGPELYDRLGREGFGVERASVGLGPREGVRLAAVFKALLNILALGLSPHGSASIIETQVDELCRRFRKYKGGTAQGGGQRKHGTKEAASTMATGSASPRVATASRVTDATKNGSLISGAAASVNGAEEKVVSGPTEPVREPTNAVLQAALGGSPPGGALEARGG